MKIHKRASKTIFDSVRYLFGDDIVDSVYIADEKYSYESTENFRLRVQDDEDRLVRAIKRTKSGDIDKHDVNYDSIAIAIKFKNGKTVRFSASEWARFEFVKSDDIKIMGEIA